MVDALSLHNEGIITDDEFHKIAGLLNPGLLNSSSSPSLELTLRSGGSHNSVARALWLSLYEENQDVWRNVNYNNLYAMSSSVPLSLLYVLEKYAHVTVVKPDLRIHVIGAAYAFEGRSDWKMFRKMLRKAFPQVKRLHVLIDLATPWLADNSVAVRSPQADHDNPDMKFNGMKESRWHKQNVCFKDIEDGVFVNCEYGFYQDAVLATHHHRAPDLVFMANPGLAQAQRRTFDPVLRYLLSRNITIVISTMTKEEVLGHVGSSYDPWKTGLLSSSIEFAQSEPMQCASVMKAYGAMLIQTSVSPFPMNLGLVGERFGHKNSILHVYKGYQHGRAPCKPKALPQDELTWLLQKNKTSSSWHNDDKMPFDPDFATVMLPPVCPAMERAVADNVIRLIRACPAARIDEQAQALVASLSSATERRIKVWDWPMVCALGCDDLYESGSSLC